MSAERLPVVRQVLTPTLLLIVLSVLAAAPASADFQITRWVVGNGGGHRANGTSSVDGTAGQAAVGLVSGPYHEILAGFWAGSGQPTAVDETAGMPAAFALLPNRPNPFNPVTTLRYAVPEAAVVSVRVFDVRGRLVATLADGPHVPGYHELTFHADGLPSGLYLCRMESDAFAATEKLILLK